MSAINTEFAAKLMKVIKKHRIVKKMSLTKLAELAGVSQPYTGMMEKGQYVPTINVVYSMANALETPLWKLVKEAEALKK
jgi:transcriptional regulator with XRE-family HTH domain